MTAFLFFLFACVAIASAVMVIVHRNPIYSALFLIVTLFSLAGLYVLLNAPFIAAIHVIIYAGAIMVLFLFVIMLLDVKLNVKRERSGRLPTVIGLALGAVLVAELAIFISSGVEFVSESTTPAESVVGDTKSVGLLLFTKYLFPFEIASVLLLAAIVGSVILAKLKLKS